MTQPRAHAELAIEFYSDADNKCWVWSSTINRWVELEDSDVIFHEEGIYHVGKEAPTEPPVPMCELAGVKFPMPVQEPLFCGQVYWVAAPGARDYQGHEYWDDTEVDHHWLAADVIHLTKKAAIQHGLALEAANKQAVEREKEKIK